MKSISRLFKRRGSGDELDVDDDSSGRELELEGDVSVPLPLAQGP